MRIWTTLILVLLFSLKGLSVVEIGELAPGIELKDYKGKQRSLEDYRGNIVLVDFWASWCGPCRNSNPELVRIYEQYTTNGFEILSVSLDKDKNKWINAIRQDQLPWEGHVSDLKGWDSEVIKAYSVQALPTQFLIDREGKIVAIDLSLAELADELENLLIEEAAIYPINATDKLFMNVYTRYYVYNQEGKKVEKGFGNEIDVSKLDPGKYNVVVGEKDHWFTKLKESRDEIEFYPKNVASSIKMSKATKYEISNLKGNVILSGEGAVVDVQDLHIGVYYINMNGVVGKFLKK